LDARGGDLGRPSHRLSRTDRARTLDRASKVARIRRRDRAFKGREIRPCRSQGRRAARSGCGRDAWQEPSGTGCSRRWRNKHPGRRPYGLATPLGKADNLKRIRGVGPQNETRLHGLGIWHVSQIAAWTDENVKWVGSYLGSSGRTQRDNWVAQARDLAAGKGTESSRRVAAGKVPPPKDDGSLGQDNVQTLK